MTIYECRGCGAQFGDDQAARKEVKCCDEGCTIEEDACPMCYSLHIEVISRHEEPTYRNEVL